MNTDFTKVTNLKQYLTDNKYNVYVTNSNTSTFITDYNNPEIYKRLKLNSSGYLEFQRFASEQDDTTPGWVGLYPRVELVAKNNLLQKGKNYHAQYQFAPLGTANTFRGVILQFFDHATVNNDGLPLFQFLIGSNKLQVVYRVLDDTGNNVVSTQYVNIADITWGSWYNMDIYFNLGFANTSFIRVYCNNKKVWERIAPNGSNNTKDVQVQYGVYGRKGVELRTQVRLISWALSNSTGGGGTSSSKQVAILAIGQSNMIGAGSSDDSNALVSSNFKDNVVWYDYNTPHSSASNSLFKNDPIIKFQTTQSSSSPVKYCANELLKNDIKSVIIPMAQSGTSIDQWSKGSTIFNNVVNACKEVFSLRSDLKLDLVIWVQGESNRTHYTNYEQKLAQVMADLNSSIPQWDASTVLVCAEISSKVINSNIINADIKDFVLKNKNVQLVESSEYPTLSDNMHFNKASLVMLGEQYAIKYSSVV